MASTTARLVNSPTPPSKTASGIQNLEVNGFAPIASSASTCVNSVVTAARSTPTNCSDGVPGAFLIAFVTVAFAIQGLPTVVAGYRERRILRRLATTPVGPVRIIAAQLAINLAVALVHAPRLSWCTRCRTGCWTSMRCRRRSTRAGVEGIELLTPLQG